MKIPGCFVFFSFFEHKQAVNISLGFSFLIYNPRLFLQICSLGSSCILEQKSHSTWPQEAYCPQHSKHFLSCHWGVHLSWPGGGEGGCSTPVPAGGGGTPSCSTRDLGPESEVPPPVNWQINWKHYLRLQAVTRKFSSRGYTDHGSSSRFSSCREGGEGAPSRQFLFIGKTKRPCPIASWDRDLVGKKLASKKENSIMTLTFYDQNWGKSLIEFGKKFSTGVGLS